MNILRLKRFGGKDVRRVEHRLAAQLADTGLEPRLFRLLHPRGPALPGGDLRHPPPLNAIGVIDERHRLQQAGPVLVRNTFKHGPIGSDGFEQLGRFAQSFDQEAGVNVRRGSHSHPA